MPHDTADALDDTLTRAAHGCLFGIVALSGWPLEAAVPAVRDHLHAAVDTAIDRAVAELCLAETAETGDE